MSKFKVVGINFDHMHMGDNLRMVFDHPDCEIAGICDEQPARMTDAVRNFSIPENRTFTDYRKCIESTDPDLVILCPATAQHGTWTERVAPYGKSILIEKPFAATLQEADHMLRICQLHHVCLAINWPLTWYPPHRTAKRLIDEGIIGDLREVHFYDGNRGPLWHTADKVEKTADMVAREKRTSWFYQSDSGGGSLLDYLGYGTTLGTWFLDGQQPVEVTCTVDEPDQIQVDEHSITVARYRSGLSKFETRWGTFTDPWTHQPQPKCGFVLVGSDGTISSYDYELTVRLQTAANPEGVIMPVDVIDPPYQNPVQYVHHCLTRGIDIDGPLSPTISRVGQQIVDTAFLSAQTKRTLPLVDG